jgi:hypothetical protein
MLRLKHLKTCPKEKIDQDGDVVAARAHAMATAPATLGTV